MKTYRFRDVVQIMTKNALIIICSTLIIGGLSFVYAKHHSSTTYSNERMMMIQHQVNYNRRADAQVGANQMMMQTYSNLIESPQVTNQAWKDLPKKMKKQVSKSDVSSMIDAKNPQGTVLMKVKATADDPKTATEVANTTAETAAKMLPEMNHDANRITLYQVASVKDASAIHHGHVKKYTAAGLVLGLIIGMTFGFIRTSWKDVK